MAALNGNTTNAEPVIVKCPACNDTGMILRKESGREYGAPCQCSRQAVLNTRLKRAAIPDGFKHCTFQNYKPLHKHNEVMLRELVQYLKAFSEIKEDRGNSFGFIAAYGQSLLDSMDPSERIEARQTYNSAGLGKTHLLIAAARHLLQQGQTVVYVNEVDLLHEMVQAQTGRENKLDSIFHTLFAADVILLDELGRSKPTENKQGLLYRLINTCYLEKKPILFASNECMESLEDRIGTAALDRLCEMAGERIIKLVGPSYRRRAANV